MRRTILSFAALLVVMFACADPTGWEGPIGLGIVAGDGQVVEAGRDSLIEQLVAQVYRDESGAIGLRVGPRPLLAQTAIGVGVPNVLTQSRPVGDDGLVAFVDYDESDSQGFVSYWYEGATKAGQRCAEIRAIVDGEPAKLATTCSEVKAGPPVMKGQAEGDIVGSAIHDSRVDAEGHATFLSVGWDQYENPSDAFAFGGLPGGWLMPAGATFGTVEARTLVMAAGHGVGDTTTVIVRDGSGAQLCACAAEIAESSISDASGWQDTTWSVTLRYRP